MANPFGSDSDEEDMDDSDPRNSSEVHHKRGAIHEKPLSAFISSVPPELCGPTAEFNPFQFWNKSSEEIEKWSEQINVAIKTAVNRHHRGFNQATTEFDEILSAFHDSEIKFKRLVSNLLEARKLLHQSRGENGKTASIAKQWKAFESYKKKLKELDKIEYILEIPQIFERYLTKKQFIHATVLLEDGRALYATSLTPEAENQLLSSMNMILNKQNDLEKLLKQQLFQQIYFKTNSLRLNLLRPQKRNPNKNILNLLNFQKEIMMDQEEDKKTEQKGNTLLKANPHYKNVASVHYDTLQSLNDTGTKQSTTSGIKKHRNVLTSTSQPTSLSDPHKIIVPTYKSFRNLDDIKEDDSIGSRMYGDVQHLLVAETTDEYLKLASNNNNYNDDEQPLFLTICVSAIDKLGRSVGAKTHLFKSLDAELREIIEREIYEVCNSFQQSMIQSNQMGNLIEMEEQSLLLLSAAQNVFKMFIRVLSNHKTVINVFKQSERLQRLMGGFPVDDDNKMDRLLRLQTYSIHSVWNGIQKAILHNLLYKYLDKHLLEEKQSQSAQQKQSTSHGHGAVDFLLNTVNEESEDNILKVRSVSPSPTPQSSNRDHHGHGHNREKDSDSTKSFGKRLKESKFFRRKNSKATLVISGNESDESDDVHAHDGYVGKDLFASSRISSKYHDTVMDGLTFSFADSNIGSIVRDNEYGIDHHQAMPSEFAAHNDGNKSSRMSLTQLNQSSRIRGATVNAFSAAASRQKRAGEQKQLQLQPLALTKSKSKGSKALAKSISKGTSRTGTGTGTRRKDIALIEASPYHVTKLYKAIIHFVESAEWKVLLCQSQQIEIDDEYDLRRFLLSFVKDRFIPHMQGEAYGQAGQILLDNQPMDQIRIVDEPLLLLKSSSGVFDLIKALFEYYVVLPVFDSVVFVETIETIFRKVRDTYKQAIDEICDILISRDLIYDKKANYMAILNAYNLRKLFEYSDDDDDNNNNDPYKDKYDRRAYETMEETKKLDRFAYEVINKNKKKKQTKDNNDADIKYFVHLIRQNEDDSGGTGMIKQKTVMPTFNTEYYSKLALISTGLFWMKNKITAELIEPLINKKTHKHSALNKLCDFLRLTFEPRCEQCISIIRMEIRSQSVCLLKNISLNNYWMKDDSIINKPQDFIIQLNKLLVSCEAKLSGCLQAKLITYLFVELAYFICEIIIYQIPLVKSGKINHVGYKQLYKNTFSLQQNLTTITQKGMEKCFDRAQKYLKLSQKTPEDIKKIQDIKNKKYGGDKEKYAAYNFSKDQYDAISTVAKLSNAHRH